MTAPATSVPVLRRDYLAVAIEALVFLTPLDGFTSLTRTLGFSPATLAGYITFLLALPRIGQLLRLQRPHFWVWMTMTAIGTAIAALETISHGSLPGWQLTTAWQALGLMALVSYACLYPGRGRRLVVALMYGLIMVLFMFVVLVRLDIETYANETRTLLVYGMHTNMAGAYAATEFLLIVSAYKLLAPRMRIAMLAGGLPVCLYVLLACNSRGGTLALVIGLLAMFLLDRRRTWRMRGRSVAFALVAAGLLYFAVGRQRADDLVVSQRARWEQTAQMGVETFTNLRSAIWSAAWALALERPTGYGSGNSAPHIAERLRDRFHQKEVDPHNEYIRVLVECGFLGIILYIAGHIILLRYAWNATSEATRWALPGLICIQTVSMTASTVTLKIAWIVCGLVGGLAMRLPARAAPVRVVVPAGAPMEAAK